MPSDWLKPDQHDPSRMKHQRRGFEFPSRVLHIEHVEGVEESRRILRGRGSHHQLVKRFPELGGP